MSPVGIVTDSTADIPPRMAAERGIAVVPCQVFLGRERLLDGVDLTPEDFFRKMAESSEPLRTSQPSAGAFVETYRSLLEGGSRDGLLSIHIAGTLSGTVNAAWSAAQLLPDPSLVEVVDTGQLSMGTGWAVIEAAERARSGATRAQIRDTLREIVPRLRVAAMVGSLANLVKSGRISYLSAALGTALRIHPLLNLHAGNITLLDRVRTRSRAIPRLAEHIRAWGLLSHLAIMHTDAHEHALELAGMLRDQWPGAEPLVAPAGAALAAHLGLGAVGACALAVGRPGMET